MAQYILGPDGEPVNPAQAYQLIPDEIFDRLYDAFNSDSPMSWEIESDEHGKNFLRVFGWRDSKTDEEFEFSEYCTVSVPVEIPKGYVSTLGEEVSDANPINQEITILAKDRYK